MPSHRPSDPPEHTTRTRISITAPRARPSLEPGSDCVVIIYAVAAQQLGRRFVLDPAVGRCTVGRGADNTIMLDSDAVSRRHARFELRDGQWLVVDSGSTNGTTVNGAPVAERILARGDHIKIGDTIFKYLAGSDVEAAYHEEIYRMTILDGLTLAHNKRYLVEQMEREVSRARRHGRPLALVMMDLDHFRNVNNSWGHLAGDHVLREAAGVVRGRIRRDEVFARYGGEEFALLVPETSLEGARTLAEDLRAALAAHRFEFDGQVIAITASLGVSALGDGVATGEELLRAADARLLEAKRLGRNRVVG